MSNIILDAIMGLAVADALGVPVEFQDRSSLVRNPVIDMRSYGTYNQPEGTWSDDTSMTLCLVDSLINGLDYDDIMNKFAIWYKGQGYNPHGETFDIGNTTRDSIIKFIEGSPALESGGKSEKDNGNGSLMRILPILFYIQSIYEKDFQENEEVFDIIHNVSSLTHGHKRSQMACGIYVSIASMLTGGIDLKRAIDTGLSKAMDYYKKQEDFQSELIYFDRLEDENFKVLEVDDIRSGGYVVDTLEAALWCLLNTDDYKSSVLKAVNLGRDTDTVGAVVGGLAGIAYGYESIPLEWIETIARRDYIEDLCKELDASLLKRSVKNLF